MTCVPCFASFQLASLSSLDSADVSPTPSPFLVLLLVFGLSKLDLDQACLIESNTHRRRLRGEDEDLLADILLRLPPQPSTLPRVSSVCRSWRRLVSDPGFLGRFRARHRSLPLLGVFMGSSGYPFFRSILEAPDDIPYQRFPLWQNKDDTWDLLGVRHGRVLIFNHTRREFLVWDQATCDRRCVAAPSEFDGKKKYVCNGAVLCAAGEQGHAQHGECHTGPIRLRLLVTDPSMG
ncbi:hypothetical protein HU200_002413 [Digitaria exilis]|uniref:F-box domain-containing protein n=1 Tax=Digitaria exilis TaxID=1010633 RepID=A0A835FZM2_9POAL|nr:hypothetical protein HU200_002413 [Digitaria exilis]